MKTALYVFIGVLAALLAFYIFDTIVTFARKIKRKLDDSEPKFERPRYDSYYGMNRQPYYYGTDTWRLRAIQDKLDSLEEKIDQLLEDTGELILAKERPEED